MSSKISESMKKHIHYTLNQIDEFSILISTFGILLILIMVASNLFQLNVQPLTRVIGDLGIFILFGIFYRWRHIPISIFIVPLLYLLGIKYHWNSYRQVKEQVCHNSQGKVLGELRYENDLNGRSQLILDLKTHDPFEMGYAHGFLLAPDILELSQRFLAPMIFLCRILKGDYSGQIFNKKSKNILVPKNYQTEFDGILAGIKEYSARAGIKVKIREKDLDRVHKFSNVYKAIGCQSVLGIKKFHLSIGCSTAVIKSTQAMTVGRTLDWLSMGMMGAFSLIRRHPTPSGKKIESHTFPGFIGALTAHSSSGLIAIINEMGATSREGVPYHLLARTIVETCNTVEEVKIFIDNLQGMNRPASSHHLIVADQKSAINFQFYTNEKEYYFPRYLNQNGFFVVTNHAVNDGNGEIIRGSICDLTSKKRFNTMTQTIQNKRTEGTSDRQAMVLGLHSVSNTTTTGSALYCLNGTHYEVQYASDNFFAADLII